MPEYEKPECPKEREVEFPIEDIFFPEPATVLQELHGKSLLQGTVMELAEGPGGEMFAVVKVAGVSQPVLVPVRCVRERG